MYADHKARNPVAPPPKLPLRELNRMKKDCMTRIAMAYEMAGTFKERDKVVQRLFDEKRAIEVMIRQHD